MAADGYIRIDTKINQAGAQAGLASLTKSLKGFAVAAGLAFGVAAIASFTKSCINLASNLAEVQNVVDVTFGSASDKINNFAKTAATGFGLSELAAKQYTGTMGAMLKSMGFTTSAAADMSIEMASLAGDMASFYNLDTDEAFAKIRSGISGETEPLKQLGVNLSEANLQAYALAQGMTQGYSSLSEQNKALIRYNYLLDVTKDAQGDFARTSGSWANQVRVLKLQWDSLKASLGGSFIAVLAPVLGFINRILGALTAAASMFAAFISLVTGTQQTVSVGAGAATDAMDGLGESTDAAGAKAAGAGSKAKKGLAAFDELNVLSSSGGGGGGGGGGAISLGTQEAAAANAAAQDAMAAKMEEFFGKYQAQIAAVRESWDGFKQLAIGMWSDISAQASAVDIGGAAFQAVLSVLQAIGEAATLVIGVISSLVVAFNIPATIEAVLLTISAAFTAIAQAVDAVTPGVIAFVDAGIAPIVEWVGGKLREALGFATDQFKKLGDWFAGHKEDFTELGVAVGDLVGKLWAVIEPIADAAWSALSTSVNVILDGLLAVGSWCLDHQELLTNIAIVVGSIAAAWYLVNGAIIAWNLVAGIGTAITTGFAAATSFLGVAFGILTSPITLIVLAIAAVIAIVILCIKYWDEIKAVAVRCWEGIAEVWGTVASWFDTNVIQPVVGFFTGLWEGIVGIFQGIIDWVASNWQSIVLFILNPFAGVFSYLYNNFEGFRNFVAGVVQAVVGFFTTAWASILTTATTVWAAISEFFTTTGQTISETFTTVWTAIKDFVVLIWTGISDAATTAWTTISNFFTGIMDGIKLAFSNAWENIKSVWAAVAGWFNTTVIDPITKAFQSFQTTITNVWDAIWAGIKSVINSILGGVESFINGIVRGVNLLISGLNTAIGLGSEVTNFLGIGNIGAITPWSTVALPRLAQGAVIPPNREFAAILGDQKHGVNIETPLDTMIEAFKAAIADMGTGGNEQPVNITVVCELDGKTVARNQVRYLPKEYGRIGTSTVRVGGIA